VKTYDASKIVIKIGDTVIEGFADGVTFDNSATVEPPRRADRSGSFSVKVIRDDIAWLMWRDAWVTFWQSLGVQLVDEEALRIARGGSESCWRVLGISPFADERAIKRAYARLVRENPPEGDAAAFQRVRDAYVEALDTLKPLTGFDESGTEQQWTMRKLRTDWREHPLVKAKGADDLLVCMHCGDLILRTPKGTECPTCGTTGAL